MKEESAESLPDSLNKELRRLTPRFGTRNSTLTASLPHDPLTASPSPLSSSPLRPPINDSLTDGDPLSLLFFFLLLIWSHNEARH